LHAQQNQEGKANDAESSEHQGRVRVVWVAENSGGRHHDESGHYQDAADDAVQQYCAKAQPPAGRFQFERRSGRVRDVCYGRDWGERIVRNWRRSGASGRAELADFWKVAEWFPLGFTVTTRLGLHVGAAAGDPFMDLSDGDRSVFLSVSA
jgi:hypothetical protein